MLHEVFYWLFSMSITASIVGLVILLLRRIKRLPRRLSIFLWAIPFLRLTVPFALNSPHSMLWGLSRLCATTVTVFQPAQELSFTMLNSVSAAQSYFPIIYKAQLLGDIFRVASVVWITVAAVRLLLVGISYFLSLREVGTLTHVRDKIYLSDRLSSPGVYGIFRPKILLPAAWKDRNLELVLLHEQTHIRTRDNLWRILAMITVSLHWFNPLCWLFLKAFLADLELACDERVLAKVGADRAKEYASTLLESRQGAGAFASAFGGANIRTRIENILSFRKLTWLSLTVFSVLMGIIFYTLLTNAG